jgi:hypothetical protein
MGIVKYPALQERIILQASNRQIMHGLTALIEAIKLDFFSSH